MIIQKEVEIDEYLKGESRVIKVDSIYFDAIDPSLYLVNGHPCEFYNPILITEEWLMELGFNYSYEFDEWFENPDDSGFMMVRNYETGKWSNGSVDILYIHELQNLYKMKRGIKLSPL